MATVNMIIMRGLPASGKSTRAKELIKEMGGGVRINKDLLRTMLHFDKWSGKNEAITRRASVALARFGITNGLNMIIDDTNMNDRTLQAWKDLANEMGVKAKVVEMNTPLEECVVRDRERDNSVGADVIINMALRSGIVKPNNVVICDIDGTVANIEHRLHFVKKGEGEKKDWKGFFEAMDEDPVREEVKDLLFRKFVEGKTIIFMSGRPEEYKERTIKWLNKNDLGFALTLIMRRSGDKRDDTIVKKEMLDTYFADKKQIDLVIDDRPSVIRMWRENGLEVMDVGKGEEF